MDVAAFQTEHGQQYASQDLVDGGCSRRACAGGFDELFLFQRMQNRVKGSERYLFAASARTAAFASTCLFASIFERSAPSTALWRALSSGVAAVGSTLRRVGASVGSLAGSAERLFSLSA